MESPDTTSRVRSIIVEISNTNSYQQMKPTAPTAPPGGNIENRKPPSPPQKPENVPQATQSASTGVNLTSLQMPQDILSDFSNVSELNTEQQEALTTRLSDANLLAPGSLINTTA